MRVNNKYRDKDLEFNKKAHNFYIHYYYYCYKRIEFYFIRKGCKLKSKRLMLELKSIVKKATKVTYFVVFFFCFFNLYPVIGLRPLRLGGQKKEIPVLLSLRKRVFLVRKLLLKNVLKKKTLDLKILSDIIINTFYMKGRAVNELMESYKVGATNNYLLHLIK